jgi:type I restriction enzyme S subunit
MSEWKKVKLGDCITTKKGFAFKSQQYVDNGIPVVRVSDFTLDSISNSDLVYYPLTEYEAYSDYVLSEKDILIQTVGSWQYNPNSVVGKVVRVPYYHTGSLLNQNIVKIIPSDNMDKNFVYYRLKCRDFSGFVVGEARGAANQASITLDTIKRFSFPIPPISTQRRIATILSRYDSLIENYQKQIKLLEEAAQRLYKEWFVDLHFPGHENTKIVDGVPEGWVKKKLEDIFSYVRGRSYTSKELSDSGTILVNLKNIQAFGGYKRDAEKRYLGDYKQEQSLEVGDLIMGVTDMTQERRLVGHVALIPEFKEPATFSMDLIKILPFELSKSFLYCAMRFGGISKQIAPLANGVNVLHLKPEAMMGIEMMVPSKELIKHFDDYYNHGFNTILHLQDQIRLLTEARDRLLPKLMSGEIAV